MSVPEFSILIPTIGRPDLCALAIESVRAQSRDISWEIIVADSSRGNAVEQLVQELADQRIHYFKTPNHDPSLGWDFAYKQSRGAYVMWFDDDNFLLPHALSTYARVIEKSRPEIITAHHLYFYDAHHVSVSRRMSIAVTPFEGIVQSLDPMDVVHKIFGGRRRNAHFRGHPAATVFSRELCERAVSRVGYVVLPHKVVNHSLPVILFGLARSCVGIGIPLSIVGRLGRSLTQGFNVWQTFKSRTKRTVRFRYSPVSGDLIRNHIAESNLEAKAILADELKDVPFNMDDFLYHQYGQSLFFADLGASDTVRLFRELRHVARTDPRVINRAELIRRINRLTYRACMVQPIKSSFMWPLTKTISRSIARLARVDKSKEAFATSETVIPLRPFRVATIAEAASQAREIILKTTGKDILTLTDGL